MGSVFAWTHFAWEKTPPSWLGQPRPASAATAPLPALGFSTNRGLAGLPGGVLPGRCRHCHLSFHHWPEDMSSQAGWTP